MLLAKYNTDGTLQWVKTKGTAVDDNFIILLQLHLIMLRWARMAAP
jgi:hypothetical protein